MTKKAHKTFLVIFAVFLVSGCYHAKITTGESPTDEVYEEKWAASWIGGLVPPEVVNVSKECANGVAMVETRHSFLNMLVGGLTAGIFTPMQITVTCAEGATSSAGTAEAHNRVVVSNRDSEQEMRVAMQQATDQAVASGKPVFVHF